jgi:hypothetical protein
VPQARLRHAARPFARPPPVCRARQSGAPEPWRAGACAPVLCARADAAFCALPVTTSTASPAHTGGPPHPPLISPRACETRPACLLPAASHCCALDSVPCLTCCACVNGRRPPCRSRRLAAPRQAPRRSTESAPPPQVPPPTPPPTPTPPTLPPPNSPPPPSDRAAAAAALRAAVAARGYADAGAAHCHSGSPRGSPSLCCRFPLACQGTDRSASQRDRGEAFGRRGVDSPGALPPPLPSLFVTLWT